mmetsp:Transcript_20829/g.59041  ORF Transcript_20829/g.59041 Transcript_20829/m.59041 type:complete len:249 (-) Transcript_20829:527-1273(-)
MEVQPELGPDLLLHGELPGRVRALEVAPLLQRPALLRRRLCALLQKHGLLGRQLGAQHQVEGLPCALLALHLPGLVAHAPLELLDLRALPGDLHGHGLLRVLPALRVLPRPRGLLLDQRLRGLDLGPLPPTPQLVDLPALRLHLVRHLLLVLLPPPDLELLLLRGMSQHLPEPVQLAELRDVCHRRRIRQRGTHLQQARVHLRLVARPRSGRSAANGRRPERRGREARAAGAEEHRGDGGRGRRPLRG